MHLSRIPSLTDSELNRALASARNRRDAFGAGNEPASVLRTVRALIDEQNRRSDARKAARNV